MNALVPHPMQSLPAPTPHVPSLRRLTELARRLLRVRSATLHLSGDAAPCCSAGAVPGSTASETADATLEAQLLCPATHVVLGTLAVADAAPRHWTADDRHALRDVAAGLAEVVSTRREAEARAQECNRLRALVDGVPGAGEDGSRADTGHELRTPLQAIVGFTSFLQTETRPEMVAAHARTIQAAAEALLAVIDRPATAPAEDVELDGFAHGCLDLVRPAALGKALHLSFARTAAVPARAGFDRQRVQQVLLNLLNNAVKYTDAGSVRVELARSDTCLHFSVCDTGIGVPTEKVEEIFHRFSRLDTTDRPVAGTGLGLSISRRIVASLGGEIGVRAPDDTPKGSVFWFTVPVRWASVAATPDDATPNGEEPPEAEGATEGAYILLADDLDLNRKLISDMLSVEGHQVDSVADGAAAVQAAREGSYDLILMDMIMPGMDGVAATRAIRALPAPACDVPIVALTAHSLPEQLDSCIQAGMDATLTKPMTMNALTDAVATWMRRRRKAA